MLFLRVAPAILGVAALAGLVVACGDPTTESAVTSSGAATPYVTPQGQTVDVVGSGEEAIILLEWAFSRFEAVGLSEPAVGQIEFAAGSPECTGLLGWATRDDITADIGICIPLGEICRLLESGLLLTPTAKACMLHELGHVWLEQHTSDRTQQAFMALTGAEAWRDPDAHPRDRGEEQAAEVMAWALSDESWRTLGRGLPPCDQLEDAYRTLTGSESPRTCP